MSIAREIEPIGTLSFTRPARRARRRYTLQYFILATIIVGMGAIVVYSTDLTFAWYWLGLGFVLAPLAAHVKWQHRGYAITKDHIVTRSGFWRRRTYIVPYYRVQIVDETQTVLQRRWDIATVVIDTAGSSGIAAGDPTAYDLDDEEAGYLRMFIAAELQDSLDERMQRRRMTELSRLFPGGPRGVW